jgi:hypothetical protein
MNTSIISPTRLPTQVQNAKDINANFGQILEQTTLHCDDTESVIVCDIARSIQANTLGITDAIKNLTAGADSNSLTTNVIVPQWCYLVLPAIVNITQQVVTVDTNITFHGPHAGPSVCPTFDANGNIYITLLLPDQSSD